jgi:enoyl-[acyl-carrier-protein] reductase (NADH)
MLRMVLVAHLDLLTGKGEISMLLENKVSVIYGAGGSIGGAIARGFSREGARVFLAGRTQSTLDQVADDIRANGGHADTVVLDALDETQVHSSINSVMEAAGHIDVSVNVIGLYDVQKHLEDSVSDHKSRCRAHDSPQGRGHFTIWRRRPTNPTWIGWVQDCA